MARLSRGSISISFQCYFGVKVSIRNECFAVDKIINKFHKAFLPVTYKIKIHFHC